MQQDGQQVELNQKNTVIKKPKTFVEKYNALMQRQVNENWDSNSTFLQLLNQIHQCETNKNLQESLIDLEMYLVDQYTAKKASLKDELKIALLKSGEEMRIAQAAVTMMEELKQWKETEGYDIDKSDQDAVKTNNNNVEKIVRDFENTVKSTKDWKYAGKTFAKIIGSLIFAAVGFGLGITIGFAAGFAAGIWTGPGAFVTAAMGAAAGATLAIDAMTLTAAGGVVSSLTVGGLGTFGMFKNTKVQNLVYGVTKQIRNAEILPVPPKSKYIKI